MKNRSGCALVLVALSTSAIAFGDTPTLLNFDGFPDSTIVTNQYTGLTFSNTIILSVGLGLNELEFPPHSGSKAVSDNGGPITIHFSSTTFSFGGYFNYSKPVTLSAFDAQNHPIASATSAFSSNLACLAGPPCSGRAGSSPNEFLQVASAAGFASVTITGDAAGGSFTLDDALYTSTADTTPPFGFFDTPVDKTGNVFGAIGVTGWALDTVGVTKVEIYRDPVANEAKGNFGLVFIGNAVFVAGARTDVQSLYPNYPNSNRAGWGYQLLSNFLPNSGNGTFTLHAYAYDAAGNMTEIGAPGKTIICTNASANKPFGTIDTPGQGETVSGSDYVNFGWALTPPARGTFVIPIDGSTMTVVIDGAPVGQPTYNQFRSDIASLFPGYTNSAGAVGFFHLNTMQFTNGVRAISWNVYDNAGRGEGLGSRYFTIANSGTTNAPQDFLSTASVSANRIRRVRQDSAARVAKRADLKVFLRLNALNAPLQSLAPRKDGSYEVTVQQLKRLELHLGAVRDGYVQAGKEKQSLPAGSTLDPETGIFYWQTAAPFLGNFDLFFTPDNPRLATTQVRIHIVPQQFK